MSFNFVHAGWVTFYKDKNKFKVYCREYDSNKDDIRLVYGFAGDKLLSLKKKDIIKTEEDPYAEDFKDALGEIEEIKEDTNIEEVSMNENTGLTKEEQEISDLLVELVNKFRKLESTHPIEEDDFVNAIHKLQYILAMRTVRRLYPKQWKTYKE